MKITQQIALPIQLTRLLHFFFILKRTGNAGEECPNMTVRFNTAAG